MRQINRLSSIIGKASSDITGASVHSNNENILSLVLFRMIEVDGMSNLAIKLIYALEDGKLGSSHASRSDHELVEVHYRGHDSGA